MNKDRSPESKRDLFVAMIYIFKLHLGNCFFHGFYQWLERSTALNMEKSDSRSFPIEFWICVGKWGEVLDTNLLWFYL